MPKITSHYDTLEVSEDASREVIVGAYRYLSQKWHPDKNPGDPRAAARMKEINSAYDVLSDPAKRAEYDQSLRTQRGTTDGGDDASTQPHGEGSAGADDAGLRSHYTEAIANQGRILKYALAFVIVVVGLRIAGAVFDGLQPALERHPIIALIAIFAAGASLVSLAIQVRRQELEKHSTKVLEVMYAESMRKRLVANVMGGIAGVLLAGFVLIAYSKKDTGQATVAANDGSAPRTAATVPASVATPGTAAVTGSALPGGSAPASDSNPAPVREAIRTTELTFDNQCGTVIGLAILYLNEEQAWKAQTWKVPAFQDGALLVDGRPLLANGHVLYVYAESADGQHVWKGTADDADDYTYSDEGIAYRFEHVRMPPGSGSYTLRFHCSST